MHEFNKLMLHYTRLERPSGDKPSRPIFAVKNRAYPSETTFRGSTPR